MGLSLKGPPRQGAEHMDEGDLTRAVVACYAAEDGLLGQDAAAAVLPARRALWRLVEAHAPAALAAALRARLDRRDQTGRGGVRELRRALADWLDPPPTCGHCGRTLSPDVVADAGPRGLPCPKRSRPAYATARYPLPCAAPRGPRPAYGTTRRPGPLRAAGVARCGTLALFSPLTLDPACQAAVKMLRHGGAIAYDLVVDRDARILLGVTQPIADGPEKVWEERPANEFLTHIRHPSTPPAITAARVHLDRCLDRALRANGRLVLKTQVRYFSPKGGVSRADLIQAGMMGLRRALLDYDPNFRPPGKAAGVKISTYAINWVHQSMGELFADHDLVCVPGWATALRRKVEEMGALSGVTPALLLARIEAVAEARLFAAVDAAHIAVVLAGVVLAMVFEVALERLDTGDECGEGFKKAKYVPLTEVSLCLGEGPPHMVDALLVTPPTGGTFPFHDNARVVESGRGDFGAAAVLGAVHAEHTTTFANIEAVHACHSSMTDALIAAANRKAPKGKRPVVDERSREQVAALVGEWLGLECTGGALLTALRYGGAPVVVPVSVGGERDDAGGGGDGDSGRGGGGGGGSSGLEHLHARADGEDEEDAALAEEDDRRNMQAMLATLATLHAADPEAAEVVRRRHGLDCAGEEETFEAIGDGLRCTGRVLCREAVRLAHARGIKAMQRATRSSGGPAIPKQQKPVTIVAHGVPVPTCRDAAARAFHTINPTVEDSDGILISGGHSFVGHFYQPSTPTHDNAPESYDPEAWAPAAMAF